MVLRGTLLVPAADGSLATVEKAFIGGLASAMRISMDELGAMLNDLQSGVRASPEQPDSLNAA